MHEHGNGRGGPRKRLPADDREACLLKTLAVNGLLNTRLTDVLAMGEHVHRTLTDPRRKDGEELVDQIARFNGNKLSFASKYAHFFLDAKRYPIYDKYVLKAIAHHFGHKSFSPTSYVEFVSSFQELERLCEFRFGLKEMDRCLWLTGMKRQWEEKR